MKKRIMVDNQKQPSLCAGKDLRDALLQADGVTCHWAAVDSLPEEMIEGVVVIAENSEARIAYPWNPAEPDAAEFLAPYDQASLFEGLEAEIADRATGFFAKLDNLWATTALQALLVERFGVRMPEAVIATIAQSAQQVSAAAQQVQASHELLKTQLVQCVKSALPNLVELIEDDLRVMVRTWALAEPVRHDRSIESKIESAVASVPPVAWADLTEQEQARLSLAVSRYALAELEAAE
jgi:hypothetical protein